MRRAVPWFQFAPVVFLVFVSLSASHAAAPVNPDLLFELDWRKFEELIAGGYRQERWEVVLTPPRGDKGIDVIATITKRDLGTIKFLDQCKAYKPGHIVGIDEIRETMGVLYRESNATKVLITTTGTFSPSAVPEFGQFMPNRLQLRTCGECRGRPAFYRTCPVAAASGGWDGVWRPEHADVHHGSKSRGGPVQLKADLAAALRWGDGALRVGRQSTILNCHEHHPTENSRLRRNVATFRDRSRIARTTQPARILGRGEVGSGIASGPALCSSDAGARGLEKDAAAGVTQGDCRLAGTFCQRSRPLGSITPMKGRSHGYLS